MADKRISDLVEAAFITANDMFVMEQGNVAKKVTGQTFESWLLEMADGRGGIQTIVKTGSTGTNPVVDTYTITYSDESTSTFTVTNGKKGTKGDQGDPGPAATVLSSSIQYAQSSSGTTPPSSGWQDNPPSSVTQGNYLWTKTVITFSDNTPVTFYAVSRFGRDGTGAVSSVCNVSPDANGNVTLSASNVGALPSTYTPPVSSVNGETGAVTLDASDVGALPSNTTAADINAAELDSNSKVKAAQASSAIVSKTASFTLALTDAGRFIGVNSWSDVTATIPTNASVAFPVGTEVEIAQLGAGAVTIAGASGVTIDSLDSMLSIAGQYATVCLKKIGTNEWLLAGALS